MTISSTTARTIYNGDGSTLTFATVFKFIQNSHVRVTLVDENGDPTIWAEGTQYLLSGAGGDNGGTVAVIISETDYIPAVGEKLVIELAPPNTQESKMPLGGAFPSTTVEQALDLAAQRDQRLADQVERALMFPSSDDTSLSAEIPSSAARKGKVLAFDATTGQPIVSTRTLAQMEQLTDSDAAESATAAAASAAAAAVSAAAAEAAAGSVNLPAIVANGWLRGNAAGTAWEIKTDAEVAAIVGALISLWNTGDVRPTIRTTAASGWVMMDDGTIGSATSGASTRANADCEDLFTALWALDNAWTAVSGGRGASAAADWAANKTIGLPKVLGRALCIAGAGAGLTSRALGEILGNESENADLLAHIHGAGGLAAASGGAHPHDVVAFLESGVDSNIGLMRGVDNAASGNVAGAAIPGGAHPHTITGSTASAGTIPGHANMQPSSFFNIEMKL